MTEKFRRRGRESMRNRTSLSTLEATWELLSTVIQQQSQGKRNIEVNSQDIGFNGGAKASHGHNISKTLDEGTTRALWWGSHHKVHQIIQQVSTHAQLEGVLRASGWVLVTFGGGGGHRT